MGLSFTIATGPSQRNHSQVRVLRDSWSHFTVSESRLPQPGGPGSLIYIPQEQGDPVIVINSESESYVTTDGQSASLSWNKAPIWGIRPDFFITVKQLRVFWYEVLSPLVPFCQSEMRILLLLLFSCFCHFGIIFNHITSTPVIFCAVYLLLLSTTGDSSGQRGKHTTILWSRAQNTERSETKLCCEQPNHSK
jgi:hypothetical protein